jgi:hypothetical protein
MDNTREFDTYSDSTLKLFSCVNIIYFLIRIADDHWPCPTLMRQWYFHLYVMVSGYLEYVDIKLIVFVVYLKCLVFIIYSCIMLSSCACLSGVMFPCIIMLSRLSMSPVSISISPPPVSHKACCVLLLCGNRWDWTPLWVWVGWTPL